MTKKYKLGLGLLLIVGLLTMAWVYLHNSNIAVLNPKGTIAHKERDLMIFGALLSLVVVIPVFVMTAYITWTFRETNHKKVKYQPEFDHHNAIEAIWWGIPILLIGILSVVMWNSSHDLDPFKSISAQAKPMTIQVVALDWKWLFIYPDQDVASVNYVQFPVNTPVKFEITSDAPMNSFWIPNLGGQIYAMSGMSTHLNLMADKIGDYPGASANISGKGFAGMHFIARASSNDEYKNWLEFMKHSPQTLGQADYDALARPSENVAPAYYSSVDHGIYDNILMKYMGPSAHLHGQ